MLTDRFRGPHPLDPQLLSAIRCPNCDSVVRPSNDGVICEKGHNWPWRSGYLDMSGTPTDLVTARTQASFGYEWTRFAAVEQEDQTFWKWYFADVPLDELSGRLGLDAGCGKGRFSRFTAPFLDHIVALDHSEAVVAAAHNLAEVSNATTVRADLRNAPFADGSFGFISCLGVLHVLKDPRAGFESLVRLLAPGGLLLLYMLSNPEHAGIRAMALTTASAVRRVTVRLPLPALRWLCAPLAVVLYAGGVLPGVVGDRFGLRWLSGLPLRRYRSQPLRALWLDTFDRLSAPSEKRYRWLELAPWFADHGFRVRAVREDAGLFIFAERPR